MILYREASPKDDKRLLKLMNSAGMPGTIQLMTTREPSFFDLITKRGLSKVFIAEAENEIIGAICVTHETEVIDKRSSPLFYISDFRVEHAHRNKGIGLELTKKAVEYMEKQDADFVFLNVSKGNKRPFVFFRNRTNYPDFENIGVFNIYQFFGSKKKTNNQFIVVRTTINQEIIDFLNEFYVNYQLAPHVDADQLEDVAIFKVEHKGNLAAVMCIADYSNCKQHIALKLPWYLRLFISTINVLRTITGAVVLPSTNEPINMLYIKYLAVKKKDKQLIKSLLRKAQNEVHAKSYSFVSLGLHEKDSLIQKLPSFFRITFNSVGMLVTMKNNQKLMDLVKKGTPYKDFSTV